MGMVLRRKILILCLLVGWCEMFGWVSTNQADGIELPFSPGEKLTFQAKWGIIPAGEAVLEVLPVEEINGIKLLHFVMTARTHAYIDPFYKVRDRIDAYTDTGMTHSFLYKVAKEGKRKKQIVVRLDREKGFAQYSNFGEKKTAIQILPGSFDPLSVFYAFRLHDLQENKRIEVPVTDGKKCVLGVANVLVRERVALSSGVFDTYLVEPDLKHIGGVFEKSRDAKLKIWVTADARRIPVRIESKLAVGSFVGELISIEGSHLADSPAAGQR